MIDVVGIKAGIDAAQHPQAANQQAGADQQHERERDLGDHEYAAGSAATGFGSGAARALFQRFTDTFVVRRNAGSSPARIPVTSEMPRVKASTHQSRPMASERGN